MRWPPGRARRWPAGSGPQAMRWILGVAFLAMAAWCLIPDKADEGPKAIGRAGAFAATAVAFFLVEMGDKTQIATVGLAARFHDVVIVTAGTTAGMMLANVPAVLAGDAVARFACAGGSSVTIVGPGRAGADLIGDDGLEAAMNWQPRRAASPWSSPPRCRPSVRSQPGGSGATSHDAGAYLGFPSPGCSRSAGWRWRWRARASPWRRWAPCAAGRRPRPRCRARASPWRSGCRRSPARDRGSGCHRPPASAARKQAASRRSARGSPLRTATAVSTVRDIGGPTPPRHGRLFASSSISARLRIMMSAGSPASRRGARIAPTALKGALDAAAALVGLE